MARMTNTAPECPWCGHPTFRAEHAEGFPCTDPEFRAALDWDLPGANTQYRTPRPAPT